MQIFGGAELKHMFHFRVKKKKKNVQSAIDDLRLFGKCFENSGCKWASRFAVLSSYKSKPWNKVLAYGIRRK